MKKSLNKEIFWKKKSYKSFIWLYLQLYDKNDFHFLEISEVTSEDKGSYTATITNDLGAAKCSAELEIFCKLNYFTF